jgi:hypothetical protein
MAVTFVASVSAAAGPAGGTTGAFNTTGATLLVVSVASLASGPVAAVSDNKSNSYTALTARVRGSVRQVTWYAVGTPTVGSGHTITVAGTGIYSAVVAYAFAGVASYGGQETGATGPSSPLATGSVTPSADGALLWSSLGSEIVLAPDTDTIPAGFTGGLTIPYGGGNNFQVSGAYLVQSTAAAISPSWTWPGGNRNAVASVAVFTAAITTAASTLVTQLVAELPVQRAGAVAITQAVVEVPWQAPGALAVTQLVIEVARPRPLAPVGFLGTPGIAWMEWRRREDEDTWQTVAYSDWDMQCPPSYYHGFKAARVESFGHATRTLSDPRTGAWQGSSCEIRLADPDRGLRTALAHSPQRFGHDALVTVRMVSRPVRAALGEPLTVFAGPIRRADPSPTLSLTLLLEDAVGHSMLTDDLLIPQRQVEAAFLPATLVLNDDAAGHPVPIIYGTHARETGAVAPIYLGLEDGTQHLWLVAGHYAAITNVFLDGISVLGTADWTIPGHPSGPLIEEYEGRRYTLLRGRAGTPAMPGEPVLYAENAGSVGSSYETWVAGVHPIAGTVPHFDVNATTGARTGARCIQGVDLRTGDFAFGTFGLTTSVFGIPAAYDIPSYDTLTLWVKSDTAGGWASGLRLDLAFQLSTGSTEDPLEQRGAVVSIMDAAYVTGDRDIGFDSTDTTAYQSVVIPISAFELESGESGLSLASADHLMILVNGNPAGADPMALFIDDITLTGGEEVAGEQTPADRAAGGAPLTINVTGWTTTGDETGTVITDLFAQYRHFLINYVANPAGYLTGGPLANPTTDLYDRVVEVVDESSFTIAADQAVTRYPPDGYIGAGVLGATASERLSVREWIARWNLSADCRFGVSRYGELFIVLADPTAEDHEAATLVEDVNDMLEGTFTIALGWEVQATRVPYRAEYNWATGTWLAVKRDANDPGRAEDYGRDIEGPVKDYWFVPTAAQGKNVAEHEVDRVATPPRVLEFETGLQLATAGLGGYLRVRHFAGVGPSEERLVQVEEVTVAPGRRRVRIRAVDVTTLVAGGA